jgi:hypothetical protein
MAPAMQRLWCGVYPLAALGLLLAAGTHVLRAADAPERDQRPNILYIMADDHAAHAISAYGSKVNKTPSIDRLAR